MISAEQLAAVTAAARLDAGIAAMRQQFPALHFSACSEDDVSPRYHPASDADGHHLYLIAGASGHCLELTNDPDIATGILLAEKVDAD